MQTNLNTSNTVWSLRTMRKRRDYIAFREVKLASTTACLIGPCYIETRPVTGENNAVVLIDNGLEITEIATVNYTHRSKCKSDFSQYFYGYRILVC